ncbi:MAG: NAD-dependent protein deacetylase [Pseudomonadota bacterium]
MEVGSFVDRLLGSGRLFVLTGAGCSTASGIADYRDANGRWKYRPPIQHVDFMTQAATRRRYWARSMQGWPSFAAAKPNGAHRALAELETQGRIEVLVTQNVDRLHQRAGSANVVDLHGRLDRVRCMDCGVEQPRSEVQDWLLEANPAFAPRADTELRPDGDADIESPPASFAVPQCRRCGGMLKPAVVFYGDAVPRAVVQAAFDSLGRADALLAVGSSLMVFSSFRFCRQAAAEGMPIFVLNRGVTRADDLATAKCEDACETVLGQIAASAGHAC